MMEKQQLTGKQRLKKKKMLLQMEKDIRELEYELKNFEIRNLKINMLKNLKISLRFGQLIVPYLLATVITFSSLAAFNATPFILDNQKRKLQILKQIDSLGNEKYVEQYDSNESAESFISYFSEWQEKENGEYFRIIKSYSIANLQEEIILKNVQEIEISSLEEVFGDPILIKKETRSKLTDEELSTSAYLEASIYSIDDDDYIYVKEPIGENITVTITWLILVSAINLLISAIRTQTSNFNFKYYVDKIKKEYPLMDVEELEKKLEIKKNNYDRLTR